MRPSSAPVRRQGRPCSSTSRSSIIGSACTQPWAIALQLKPGPAWRRSLCARQHDILIASLHSQGGSPVVAGLRASGIIAPFVLDGPMTGAAFRAYVEQVLAPALEPG